MDNRNSVEVKSSAEEMADDFFTFVGIGVVVLILHIFAMPFVWCIIG